MTDYTPVGFPMGMRALEHIIVLSFEFRTEFILKGVSFFRHSAPTVGTDKEKGRPK